MSTSPPATSLPASWTCVRRVLVLLLLPLAAAGEASRPAIEPRRLHDEGLLHLRTRSVGDARSLLARLEAADPGHGFTQLLRGHCALLLDGDANRAEALYEQARATFDGDSDGMAEALHAVGRLCRQQQRWEEADEHYAKAVVLRPSNAALAEEALFVRGKTLVLTEGGMREAAEAFELGLSTASDAWRPHFAREAAHARGLCGDAAAAASHYALARMPNASVVGDLLSALAAHHERECYDVPTAAAFLNEARRAFAKAVSGADAVGDGALAAADVHLRLAGVIEALHALGERGDGEEEAPSRRRKSSAADGGADLPAGVRAAAASYRAAIALQPSSIAARDDLAALLLGTSRVCNFGATNAAALNAEEAETLLTEAHRLHEAAESEDVDLDENDNGEMEPAAAQSAAARRSNLLDTIASTAREVAHWQQIVGQLPPAASNSPASASPTSSSSESLAAAGASRWQFPPSVASRATSVPRVEVSDASELMEYVHARRPVVITNLQADAGFAKAEAWRADSLRAAFGEAVVKVSVSPSGRFDGAEEGELWGAPGLEVLVRPPETHMRLSELLSLLARPTSESFYLEYNALHQYLGESMRQLVPMPPQAEQLRPLLSNLWLGKGSTTSPLHYDEYENLLCQVAGEKEIILFPPHDYPELEYVARPKGVLSYEWPNSFARAPIGAAARAHKVLFAASINMTHPDARRRAALERCEPSTCTLKPGETLLLPAYWHHEVYSHAARAPTDERGRDQDGAAGAERDQPVEQPLNVAVNFWFRNESAPPECFDRESRSTVA